MCSSDEQQYHICHPESLSPLSSIPHYKRAVRRVRTRDGRTVAHTFLQPRTGPPGHHNGSTGAVMYKFDSLIVEQAQKGVAIFLATPITCGDAAGRSLVSCGSRVVIKAAPQPSLQPMSACDNALAEVAAMQLLQEAPKPEGPTAVIPLLDCIQDDEFIYMILPYMANGDLFNKIEKLDDGGLPEAEVIDYLRQIIRGLRHLKRAGLAHHDLSLENVMLDEKGAVNIIDLGMCLKVPSQPQGDSECCSSLEGGKGHCDNREPPHQPPAILLASQPCRGKPSYIAPEVVREDPFCPFASDMWALGIMTYIMLTGRPLYASPHDKAFKMMEKGQVCDVIAAYEACGLGPLSPPAKDLVVSMLDADAAKRPTLEQLMENPWLAMGGEDKDKIAGGGGGAAGVRLESTPRACGDSSSKLHNIIPVAW